MHDLSKYFMSLSTLSDHDSIFSYPQFVVDDIEESLGANGHSSEAFFASAFDCSPSKKGSGYESIV